MGGKPALAMNLLCVPTCLSLDTVRRILEGGHDKAVEAGCVIAGGHTIQDNEPKYGLCVTGYVHPDKILKNVGARPGDVLILTKPLGTGVLTTAAKAELLEQSGHAAMVQSMSTLNAAASAAAQAVGGLHACTDITGFGLIGHAFEMAYGSGVSIRLHSGALPLFESAESFAEMGIIPAGAYRNMDFVAPHLRIEPSAKQARVDLIADPQTSGGLLLAVEKERAEELLAALRECAPQSAVVGTVTEKDRHDLIIE